MAGERTLPVAEVLSSVLPGDGLVRGQVVGCAGDAACTIASVLVRDAVVAGAWLAVVDVDGFGIDAAAEVGIPLERVVRVDTRWRERPGGRDDAGAGGPPRDGDLDWIDVVGAAVDGFDLVVTRVPSHLGADRRPASVRKLSARIQQRGAVVVVLGASGALPCDIELGTAGTSWAGVGDGSGHLRRRSLEVEAAGRRLPGRRTCSIELVGSEQRIELSTPHPGSAAPPVVRSVDDVAHGGDLDDDRDPQAELLAEMADNLPPHDGDVVASTTGGPSAATDGAPELGDPDDELAPVVRLAG